MTTPINDQNNVESAPQGRALSVFFSYGFRPFFLLGPLYGAVVMALFLFWIGIHHAGGQVVSLTIAQAPHIWHAHEMLFGYTMAVIAGFLLTAVPNWTGSHAVQGRMLAFITLTWLAGRLAMGFSASLPPLAVAIADLAMLPVLAPLVIAAMMKTWSKRNFIFLPIIAVLFTANLLTHLEFLDLLQDGIERGLRLALDAIILLIAIVGGRVVPAFTTNSLRNRGIDDLPTNVTALNVAGIVLVAAVLVLDQIDPGHASAAYAAIAAAAVNGLRLIGWKGHRTFGDPIVWILHLGFAWLVAGLALKGTAILSTEISEQTALHALTAGAVGTMTLAIMSRAALGHTGRPLVAAPATVLAYTLVSVGALVRLLGPVFLPARYSEGILLSGGLWTAGLAIFVVAYWPILTGPHATRGTRGL